MCVLPAESLLSLFISSLLALVSIQNPERKSGIEGELLFLTCKLLPYSFLRNLRLGQVERHEHKSSLDPRVEPSVAAAPPIDKIILNLDPVPNSVVSILQIYE